MTSNNNSDDSNLFEVQQVLIKGNTRTHLSLFQRVLEDSRIPTKIKNNINANSSHSDSGGLKSGKVKVSLMELEKRLVQSSEQFKNLGLFDSVDVSLRPSVSSSEKKNMIDVTIDVKEKGIPFLSVASFVKSSSRNGATGVTAEVQTALRNPFGFGEILKVSSQKNDSFNNNDISVSLSIPKVRLSIPGNEAKRHLSGLVLVSGRFCRDRNSGSTTSFDTALQNATVEFTSEDLRHQITLEYAMRDEIPISFDPKASSGRQNALNMLKDSLTVPEPRQPSDTLLNQAISSLKSSIKYLWTAVDTRDNSVNPSNGVLLQGTGEVALPPGDVQFLRAEVSSQLHRCIGPSYLAQPGLVASFTSSLGLLYPLPWQRAGKRTFLSDRFQLGGPLSLRGFQASGVGARAYSAVSSDSLGGETKTSLLGMLSVPVPVPVLAQANLRAFVFANAGSLGRWPQSGLFLSSMFGNLRASTGAGFSLAVGNVARVEATYSIPLLKAPQDSLQAFQVGVSVSLN